MDINIPKEIVEVLDENAKWAGQDCTAQDLVKWLIAAHLTDSVPNTAGLRKQYETALELGQIDW